MPILVETKKYKSKKYTEWEQMYTITQKDMAGNDVVYTFYFTETLGDIKEEEKEVKTDAEAKPQEEAEEEEIEKHIKGVVVALDKEYEVSGDREIEGNESSVEYKVMLDKDNYVIIENEVEGTENEYEYSKYENGKRVFKSEVEYEIDENGEIEIEFETKTPEDGKIKFNYEFKNVAGEDIISVEIKKEKANLKGEAKLRKALNEAGEVSYEFISYEEKSNENK